jgi:hypothetical protein
LREFGNIPSLDRAARLRPFASLPQGRPELRALAEEGLWDAMTEWLTGRDYPTGSARDTIEPAKMEVSAW